MNYRLVPNKTCLLDLNSADDRCDLLLKTMIGTFEFKNATKVGMRVYAAKLKICLLCKKLTSVTTASRITTTRETWN